MENSEQQITKENIETLIDMKNVRKEYRTDNLDIKVLAS